MPLEWCVGLGREVADGDVEVETPQITTTLLKHHAGIGDAEHIGIGLSRQADHEIQLHLAVPVLHGGTNAVEQVVVGQPLVDDVAQALGTGLRRKREAGLARSAEDVGDVLIKPVHPLAGQLQGHVLVRQTVAQLHPHRRQGQVIAAAERQQREVAVAGLFHAVLHGLDHRFRLHIPCRPGEHPGLTEAAATGAAAANLHGEPVVNRFHMRYQPHGVVRHRRRHPAQHPPWQLRMQRLQADAVVARFVQRRDVNPGNLSQIPQQLGTGQAIGLGLGHHQPDLGQQFLTIPQRDEIKERGIGLGIARGCGASGKDQRRCRRITQRQIASISRPDGHAAQIQHLQDVGGAEFVTQAETEDVEGR